MKSVIEQLQENSEAIERAELLKKIRVMLFSGMISYPLWGMLAHYIAPDAYDPLWQRLALSVIVGILYLTTYYKKLAHAQYKHYFIICWVYTYHLLFLYWMNADTAFYLISNLIQFPYMLLTSPTKKSTQAFTYVQMVVAVAFSLLVKYHTLNPWLFTLGVITMGHFFLTIQIERFNVLAQLKQSHQQQAINARIASMFAIAGGVAHEINNPLGIIIGRLQSLQKKIQSDNFDKHQGTEIIQKTLKTSYRIAKIVTGLKALANPTDDHPLVTVSVQEIIDDALLKFGDDYKSQNIKLMVDHVPDVKITCKKIQIVQIILNLLENACDAATDTKDKWIRISFREDNESISIAVYDSGIITSSEVKAHMMEPFYTTKEIGKGIGLGLSISKAMIDNHDGEIFLDPKSNHTGLIIKLKKSRI